MLKYVWKQADHLYLIDNMLFHKKASELRKMYLKVQNGTGLLHHVAWTGSESSR